MRLLLYVEKHIFKIQITLKQNDNLKKMIILLYKMKLSVKHWGSCIPIKLPWFKPNLEDNILILNKGTCITIRQCISTFIHIRGAHLLVAGRSCAVTLLDLAARVAVFPAHGRGEIRPRLAGPPSALTSPRHSSRGSGSRASPCRGRPSVRRSLRAQTCLGTVRFKFLANLNKDIYALNWVHLFFFLVLSFSYLDSDDPFASSYINSSLVFNMCWRFTADHFFPPVIYILNKLLAHSLNLTFIGVLSLHNDISHTKTSNLSSGRRRSFFL